MKPALADFASEPTGADAGPNVLRGGASLAVVVILTYLIFANASTAYRYDRDGVIDSGLVSSVTSHRTRRRRGRIAVTYTATVPSRYGQLAITVGPEVHAGTQVRFIYSPSLDDAIAAPDPLEPGDMLLHELLTWEMIVLAAVSLGMLWYAHDQFRWVYIVMSGRYTVNGTRESDIDSFPTASAT